MTGKKRNVAAVTAAEAEKERLATALKPFADKANGYDGIPAPKYFGDTDFEHSSSAATKVSVPLGDLRAARAVLSPKKEHVDV